jgi:hypothetical protein
MNNEGEDNFLAVYLEAGGKVWLTGSAPYSHTNFDDGVVSGSGVGTAFFGLVPRDFSFRFLKTQSIFEGIECANGCFLNSGSGFGAANSKGFEVGVPSDMAVAEGFPWVRATRTPYDASNRGIPSCEGMAPPRGLDINSRLVLFGGRLDTLYFYNSNGFIERNVRSTLDGAATGLRYSGPDQGPLMVFGFPLFWFPAEQLEPMMTASLRWLIETD